MGSIQSRRRRLVPLLAAGLLAAVLSPAAPARATADPVLVGAGDIATCTGTGDEATAALLDHLPGTVFTLGDTAYVNGTPQEFADCYGPTWGRHKDRTAIAVAGNHDYNTPGAAGFFGYFGAAAGDPAKGYFDTTMGAWHVIVLNSNCGAVGGCGAGSPQEQWLRSVLAAGTADCTLALWHEPGFSSGTVHRANPLYQPFWQALYDYGADVVLDASDHLYERFAPQSPTGAGDPAFGLRQFTVGTGGRSHQTVKSPLPNSEVRNGATYGVLSLGLHAASYDWRFVPEAGKTFTDSGTTACHGAPPAALADQGPVERVGSSSGGVKDGAPGLTLARPAATAPGQVMVASIVTGGSTSAPPRAPAGWAVVRDDAIKGALRQTVYVKVAGPSEPAGYTWGAGPPRRMAGGITTYSGVDTGHPVDAAGATLAPKPGKPVTAPSIKTSVAGARLIDFAAVNAEGTIAPPAGMTARWLAASPTGKTDDALAASSDATWPKAGATGSRTATATEPGARIGAVVALRPAAAAHPPPPAP